MVNESKSRNEAEIRQLIDDWIEAFRAKDVERIMSFYAQDVVAYDIVPPLQYKSAADYRKDWEAMLAMSEGPLGYEASDMRVVAGDDTAFCHCLNHVSGKMTGGKAFDNWMRVTVGYKKIDGKWLVVHEHVSAPIDMESGKGLFDLKP